MSVMAFISRIALEAGASNSFLEVIGSAITTVLGWLKTLFTSLFTSGEALNYLLPVLAVGVVVSLVFLVVKIVKAFTWGA